MRLCDIRKRSSLQNIGGLLDECHVYFFELGCLLLQISTKSNSSIEGESLFLHNLCASILPFFLSNSVSIIVLKSPPIINVLLHFLLNIFPRFQSNLQSWY